ncbi:MAG: zf-HC2 domain-containing protein [Chthonomonadetes bacterium]|nr:zf-HC2 domain-containing protein [Chthonomonadetes bacterium]
MKACREWERTIVEYVDGLCPPEMMAKLEAHLASCEACARTVQEHLQLKQALAQLAPEHAPAHLSRRIRDHARSAVYRRRVVQTAVRLSFAAVAAAVSAIALWWSVSHQSMPVTPSTDESTLAQAIVQEYVGATSTSGFSDPSLQMLTREAQMKTLKMEPMLQ